MSHSIMFQKPYNLTYFITFIDVATFTNHKFALFNRKPYKMFYIEDYIMRYLSNKVLIQK